jgi:lysophospholipase L1-like esterase
MRRLTILLLTCMTSLTATSDPSDHPVRIVAFGDSTTAPRGKLTVYADILRRELRTRTPAIEIINAGIGGNTTEAARQRFQADVLDRNPDLTIIQFGINDSAVDVWKNPPATGPRVSLTRYRANLQHLIDRLKAQGSAVVLMTPNPLHWTPALKKLYGRPPYDTEDPDGFNVTLRPCSEAVRQLARTNRLPLVDVYAAFQEYARDADRSLHDLLLDGMHPNAQGHRLVAQRLLEALDKHHLLKE